MKSGFPGFPPDGIEFFAKLMRNNRREWFQPRKEIFEARLKQPMRELVTVLNKDLRTFAPEYVTDPDKAIYRIYRDTRFSHDKTPYKDDVAASFYRGGNNHGHGTGGFYCAVSVKAVSVGGGVYMPDRELLAAIRNHIAAHHGELRRILRAKPVRALMGGLYGEQSTRVPKGFAADHPAADLLRYKRFILFVELPPALATSPDLYPEILRRFRAMAPFMRFLDAASRSQEKPRAARFVNEM